MNFVSHRLAAAAISLLALAAFARSLANGLP